MALSRVHNWISLETLTASDLNAEYNNILNYLNGTAISLSGPVTITKAAASALDIRSGASGSLAEITLGRTGADATIGVAANTNDILTASSAGDLCISASGASVALRLGAGTAVGVVCDNAGQSYLNSAIGTTASAANLFFDNASTLKILRSTSSVRYKTDVASFGAGRSGPIIDALNPVLYASLAPSDDPSIRHYGLLAEDVAKVAPELLTWSPVAKLDAKTDPAYVTANVVNGKVPDNVQYDRIVPILIAELQSLRARLKVAGL